MRLCLNCKTLNRSASIYCEGCGHSLGCRVCRQCDHTNSMTAQFCASCSSRRLTTPAFYLPLTWLVRLVLLGVTYALVVWIGPIVQPLWGSVWTQTKCWARLALTIWVCVTIVWLIILSLLPDKSAKFMRAFTKQSILLLVTLLKIGVRAILWIVGLERRSPQ